MFYPRKMDGVKNKTGVFSVISLKRIISLPVEGVADATSVFTEYIFGESVNYAHNSEISSTFQETDCLLKLVKMNKQVFAISDHSY